MELGKISVCLKLHWFCRHPTRTQNGGAYEIETWHPVLSDVLNREGENVLLYKKLDNQSRVAN